MRQDFWNRRYSENELAYGFPPNRYLQEKSYLLKPGRRILAAGDGEGHNGIWLARQQLDVWSVDFSMAGLKKERELLQKTGVSVKLLCVDLGNWWWPPNFFDAVVIIFVHFSPHIRRQVHHQMISTLKPSGYLIMQSFQVGQLRYDSGGPRVVEILYTAQQLQEDFADMTILELEDSVEFLQEGNYHTGEAAVINLLAQKR